VSARARAGTGVAVASEPRRPVIERTGHLAGETRPERCRCRPCRRRACAMRPPLPSPLLPPGARVRVKRVSAGILSSRRSASRASGHPAAHSSPQKRLHRGSFALRLKSAVLLAPRVEIDMPEQAKPYLDLGVKHFCMGWDVGILFDWFKANGAK